MPIMVTGAIHDYYEWKDELVDSEDGDVLIQSKLDMAGRIAAAGGHANRGYSGYYLGFLFAEGKPRKFLGWRDLWVLGENTHAAQQDKVDARDAMAAVLRRLVGGQGQGRLVDRRGCGSLGGTCNGSAILPPILRRSSGADQSARLPSQRNSGSTWPGRMAMT